MDTSLTELSAENFFFTSPFRSLVASGCITRLTEPAQDGADLSGAFQTRLRAAFDHARSQGIAAPIVVGAIPFDTRQPSALYVPERWQAVDRHALTPTGGEALPEVTARRELPGKAQFMAMVASAVQATRRPTLDKVVLSRLIDITAEQPVPPTALLARLLAQNPGSFNFQVPLADGGALLGASPELLVRKDGARFNSLPLAGSAKRSQDADEDRQRGEALRRSDKDRYEHALVTDAMRAVLAPRSVRLDVPAAPTLATTPTLWHLATAIEGQVRDPAENALSLACLLHPTPALSGFPALAARELIAELEPFDRQLFGGIVGWCDAQGNGEWAVTIRCARVMGRQVRLFAGAGIVPASSPESEWQETGVKLSTMLNVFGLNTGNPL